jgi:DNA-binding CsgD family transcriptional regulator
MPWAWSAALYFAATLLGTSIAVFIVAALFRKPSASLGYFLCFFAMSVLDFAGGFIAHSMGRNGILPFSLQDLWIAGQALSRLRFAFLVLFAHSFHRYRFTRSLSAALIIVICSSVALAFIIYTPIPEIVDTAIVIYAACYLASLLPRSGRPVALTKEGRTVRAIVYCTAFFLIGIIIDLMESSPMTGPYVSMLFLDFRPLYVLCLGALMAGRAFKDAYLPSAERTAPMEDSNGGALPVANDAFAALSKREREVLGLVMDGESNRDIAEKLFISESTVKKHVNRIFKKLKVGNRWNLLKIARGTDRIHP